MIPFPAPIGNAEILEVYEEYEEPLLYTIRTERGQTFLVVLVTDAPDEQVWHFAYLSPRRCRDLRAGFVDLRDAFLYVEGGWITALHREKASEGRIWTEPIRAADLTDDVLPNAGEIVQVMDEEPIVPDVRAIATAEHRDVVAIRFIPRIRSRKEVSISPLSRCLYGFQGCVTSIGETQAREALLKAGRKRAPRRTTGRAPEDSLRLTAGATYDSSFGIELYATATADLFGESPASDALQRLIDLLEVVGDEAKLTEKLNEFKGSSTVGKLRGLLMGISEDVVEIHIDWAAPKPGRGRRVVVTQEQAGEGLRTITSMRPEEPEEYWVEGIFDEAGFGPKTFQFIEDGPEARTLRGRIDDEALPSIQGVTILNTRYLVRIRESTETNVEGEVLHKFRLMEVRIAGACDEPEGERSDD